MTGAEITELQTYDDQGDDGEHTQQREVYDECRATEEPQQVVQGMCRLWHDSELSDEHRTASDAQSADDHPWREDVPQDDSRKNRVPQE